VKNIRSRSPNDVNVGRYMQKTLGQDHLPMPMFAYMCKKYWVKITYRCQCLQIYRNARVFEGVSPSIKSVRRELMDEHSLWCMAGAKNLQDLGLVITV
jgi:hypothetical protein